MTESEYKEIKRYAYNLSKNNASIESEDLISDAYLILYESGEKCTFENIKKAIRSQFFTERGEAWKRGVKPDLTTNDTIKVCHKCKEDLPMGAFYVYTIKKYNIQQLTHICKQCNREKSNKYKKTLNGKNSQRKYFTKIKEEQTLVYRKRKNYIQKYHQNQSGALSDQYIIQGLKKWKKYKGMAITPELILLVRQRIKQKREKKYHTHHS